MALQKSLPPAAARDLTNTDIQRIQASLTTAFPITPEKCTPRLGAPSRVGPGPGAFSPQRPNFPPPLTLYLREAVRN